MEAIVDEVPIPKIRSVSTYNYLAIVMSFVVLTALTALTFVNVQLTRSAIVVQTHTTVLPNKISTHDEFPSFILHLLVQDRFLRDMTAGNTVEFGTNSDFGERVWLKAEVVKINSINQREIGRLISGSGNLVMTDDEISARNSIVELRVLEQIKTKRALRSGIQPSLKIFRTDIRFGYRKIWQWLLT